MSPDAQTGHARRVRWFIAAHTLAVTALYGVALVIGGGFAPPPLPPDQPLVVAQAGAEPAVAGDADELRQPTPEDGSVPWAMRYEVSSSWAQEAR